MDKVFRIVGFNTYAEFIECVFIEADYIQLIADTFFKETKYYLLITRGTEQNWLPEILIDKYEILRDTRAKYLREKNAPDFTWGNHYISQDTFVLGEYDPQFDYDSS